MLHIYIYIYGERDFVLVIIRKFRERERERMLAVFDQSVAKSPEGLRSQSSVSESSALKDGSLIQDLHSSLHTNSVTINLGLPGFIAYSSHKQSPLLPRFWM
ncbi:unnamed protein product [Camellia sinensis]